MFLSKYVFLVSNNKRESITYHFMINLVLCK